MKGGLVHLKPLLNTFIDVGFNISHSQEAQVVSGQNGFTNYITW